MKRQLVYTETFCVLFELENGWVQFYVYPISNYLDGLRYFFEKEDEQTPREKFDKELCYQKFRGSYVWRGVWESRLYFDDEEYWGSDLEEMHLLFENTIKPCSEELIKSVKDIGE